MRYICSTALITCLILCFLQQHTEIPNLQMKLSHPVWLLPTWVAISETQQQIQAEGRRAIDISKDVFFLSKGHSLFSLTQQDFTDTWHCLISCKQNDTMSMTLQSNNPLLLRSSSTRLLLAALIHLHLQQRHCRYSLGRKLKENGWGIK